jgi:hypothetical protein
VSIYKRVLTQSVLRAPTFFSSDGLTGSNSNP